MKGLMYNILKIYNPGGAENFDELWRQNGVYVTAFGLGLVATAATFSSQDEKFAKGTSHRDFFFQLFNKTNNKRDLMAIGLTFGVPIAAALPFFFAAIIPGMPLAYWANIVGGWLVGGGIGLGYGTTVAIGGSRVVNTGINAFDKFGPKKKKKNPEQPNNLLGDQEEDDDEEEDDEEDRRDDSRRERPDPETSENPEIKQKQDLKDTLQKYVDKLESRRNSIFLGENNTRTDFEAITTDDIAFEAFNDAKAFLDNTFDEDDDLSNYIWENFVAKLNHDHNGVYGIDRSRLNEPGYWVNNDENKDECIKLGKAYLFVLHNTIEKSKLVIEKLNEEIDVLRAAEPPQPTPRPRPRNRPKAQPKPQRQETTRPNRFRDSAPKQENELWESFKHNFEIIRQGAEGELKKVLEAIQYRIDEYFESSVDYRKDSVDSPLKEPKTLNGAIKKYLSFSDRPESLASDAQINQIFKETLQHPSAEKYAGVILDITQNRKRLLDETVAEIKDRFNSYMTEFDLNPSEYSISDSWAYWDIAKQIYMKEHQSESSSDYVLGDPMDNRSMRIIIANRRLGKEIYSIFNETTDSENKTKLTGFLKSIEDNHTLHSQYTEIMNLLKEAPTSSGTLSSYKLARLGQLMTEVMPV